MRSLVLAVVALAGCARSNEVRCDDGQVCPADHVCDLDRHRCISPAQLEDCRDSPEGETCALLGAPGACRGGVCEPLICGDGLRSIGEACDGTDLGGADCTTAGFYAPDGLGCSSFCTFDVSACVGRCGDQIVNGTEICDGAAPAGTCVDVGFDAGPLDCATSCGFDLDSCARFGWVRENLDLTVPLFSPAVAGSSRFDTWIVGVDGVATHFDGAWHAIATPTTSDLIDVASRAPNDAWAVAADAVLHWDGVAWSAVAAPTAIYQAVVAVAPERAVVATRDHGVLAWTGTAWLPVGDLQTPLALLRGTGSDDLWAAGVDGTVTQWDGTSWTPRGFPGFAKRLAVLAPDDVWAAGTETPTTIAVVAHWDGQTWTSKFRDPQRSIRSIVATGPADVWISAGGLLHYDGIAWARGATTSLVGPMYAINADEVVVVTNDAAYRFRGQAIVNAQTGDFTSPADVFADRADNVVVITQQDRVSAFDGRSWLSRGAPGGTNMRAVFGVGDDLWVGGNGLYHWNGSADPTGWTLDTGLPNIGLISSIWASSPTDLWVGGVMGSAHFDGTSWVKTSPTIVFRILGTSPTNVWIRSATSISHWDGSALVDIPPPPLPTAAITLVGTTDVFAIASQHVLHWDGATWTSTFLPEVTIASLIAGSSVTDLVITDISLIAHFDGTRWSPMRLPIDAVASPLVAISPRLMVFAFLDPANSLRVIQILRTKPWVCSTTETCDDGIDNDCDGSIDCP